MAKRHDPDSIVTDTKVEVFPDGSGVMVISAFQDGRNKGITMITSDPKDRRTYNDSKRVF